MASILLNILSDFDTQLATASSVGGTTATLVSATDDDGNALPTGTYGFTIDAGNSSKEYIICTLTGTSLTSILSITRQGVTSSGFARTHRRGAKVTVTDWAILSRMLKLLNGTGAFDSTAPINYDAHPTFTTDTQIIDKKYVDDIAISGSPDATTAIKGIGRVSTAPASPTIPIFVGDNDPRVPTQDENDALVGNNTDIAVGTGNKMVTQTGLQKGAECYAASTTGNDTYVVTLSPVPTSLVNGMTIRFKPDTANTGAATLNVNGLGALAIVTGISTALATGDIVANQVCEVIYNSTGTVWQLVNPASIVITPPTDFSRYAPSTFPTYTGGYYTYIAPFIESNGPSLTGWVNAGFSASGAVTGAGGFYDFTTAASGSVYSLLPGFSTSTGTSGLRFDEVGSNPISVKLRVAIGLGSSPRFGFGFADGSSAIYSVYNTTTENTIRFCIDGSNLYAVTSVNGGSNTNTLITGVTTTNQNIYEIVYTSTSVTFYVNGVLKATHTTNIPTTTNTARLVLGLTAGSASHLYTAPVIITVPLTAS